MGLFDDLFHKNKQQRNAEGRANREQMNQGAPDPYGTRQGNPIYTGEGRPISYENGRPVYGYETVQNQVTFDETGRPIVNGKPIQRPGADYALDYQYLAEQEAERRRLSLWTDAQNSIRQGLDLFQTYRPGGSAALASGMFQQSASMYGTQALNTFAPDMLSEYREKQIQDAKRERERARQFSERLAMAQFGMNPLGLLNSGPTPQSPAGEPPSTAPANPGDPTAPTAPGGGAVAPGAAAGGQVGGAASGGVTPMGAGGVGGMAPGSPYQAQVGPDGQPMSSRVGRAGGSQGPTVDGGFGAGGSAGGPVGAGGSRRMGGGQGSGMGGPGGGGGGPPITTFTGAEAATRGQMVAPSATDAATSSWASSGLRSESVGLRVASARTELLDAIGIAGNPGTSLLTSLLL